MIKGKKGILIDATGGSKWIGGLYYKKNILYSLISNQNIMKKYYLIIVTEPENKDLFSPFSGNAQIVLFKSQKKNLKLIGLLFIALKKGCKFVFPNGSRLFSKFGIVSIHWIADFQHNRFPSLFSKEEKVVRTATYFNFARDNSPVVVSSYDALHDFNEFYNPIKNKIYVVPFVSYIEDILKIISLKMEQDILKKYGLDGKSYACTMNQFWQHKNHIAILKAIKIYFSCNPESDFVFVFTGKLDDYRAPEYVEKLKVLFNEDIISKHARMLGFIDRLEQLVVMKNAQFVIQPSLFEGWGTVLEDAKVLDKTVLLSNIPVHREQMNEKCRLFDPYNSDELACLIKEEIDRKHIDDITVGISDMHKRAKEYSIGFEQLLKDCEDN